MHFLSKAINPNWPIILWKPWAAVEVLVKGQSIQIQPGVTVAKGDVTWLRLPDGIRVLGQTGDRIQPGKGKMFLISSETFDPCHLLTEVESRSWGGG